MWFYSFIRLTSDLSTLYTIDYRCLSKDPHEIMRFQGFCPTKKKPKSDRIVFLLARAETLFLVFQANVGNLIAA